MSAFQNQFPVFHLFFFKKKLYSGGEPTVVFQQLYTRIPHRKFVKHLFYNMNWCGTNSSYSHSSAYINWRNLTVTVHLITITKDIRNLILFSDNEPKQKWPMNMTAAIRRNRLWVQYQNFVLL
jgi:hypothetical protein